MHTCHHSIQQLLELSSDVNNMGALQVSPMHIACSNNNVAVIEILLNARRYGCEPPDLDLKDARGRTPTEVAKGDARNENTPRTHARTQARTHVRTHVCSAIESIRHERICFPPPPRAENVPLLFGLYTLEAVVSVGICLH